MSSAFYPACFCLCPGAGSGAPWPAPLDRQLLSAWGLHGARKCPCFVTGPQFCPGRLRLEAPLCGVWGGRRGVWLSPGGAPSSSLRVPQPAALGARPPPGSPLLDLSQPVLLSCHLLSLSLHMAREGPQEVALLVSVSLCGRQGRNLSGGLFTSHPLTLPRPPWYVCGTGQVTQVGHLPCTLPLN